MDRTKTEKADDHTDAGSRKATRELEQAREEIDSIDRRILSLLGERQERAVRIGRIKRRLGLGVLDSAREKAVLEGLADRPPKGLSPNALRAVFTEIMAAARSIQEEINGMKQVWVRMDEWDNELATTALESGADAMVVPSELVEGVRALGRIPVVSSEGGDLRWGRDVVEMEAASAEDEEKIVQEAALRKVVVKTSDWKVIPLENLVARTGNLFVTVQGLHEMRTALGVLERGVDGVVISAQDPDLVRRMIREAKGAEERVELSTAEITAVTPVGMGDRVCVDTCSLMGKGTGMLVGDGSAMLFLVHAESEENPYVSPRPFRVNAGAVHAYAAAPEGRTRYLSELSSGDPVLVADYRGRCTTAVVGRAKVERRPLLAIRARGPGGEEGSLIVQNAETIRMVAPEGDPLSVVKLGPGDRVLVRTDNPARHFGRPVEETISER